MTYLLRLVACLFLCVSLNSFGGEYTKIFNNGTGYWYSGIVNPILDLNGNIHPYSGARIKNHHNLSHVNLSQANLNNAYIRYSNLTHSTLVETDFSFSDAAATDFSHSNLLSANFNSADLLIAKFNYSDLSNADFTNAFMDGVELLGANLSGANLSFINLCCNQIYVNRAIYSETTTFPSSFDPEARGMIFVSEVPLPAGIYLFLSGLVGLGLMRGNRSK